MQSNDRFSILVTAGGTKEDIDAVRSITNHSSGRLGSLIADTFLKNGAKVTYLCGEGSLLPALPAHEVIIVRNVRQLAETLDDLLQNNLFDCIIHSMAVSDFTPFATMTVEEMVDSLQRELKHNDMSSAIQNVLLNSAEIPAGNKISSRSPYLVLALKQTPKVIRRIKSMQPQALLVGFKLLSGSTESELLEAGLGLIESLGCDYVLANDLADISGDKHKAVLMNGAGALRSAETKQDIARIIFETFAERMGINE